MKVKIPNDSQFGNMISLEEASTFNGEFIFYNTSDGKIGFGIITPPMVEWDLER